MNRVKGYVLGISLLAMMFALIWGSVQMAEASRRAKRSPRVQNVGVEWHPQSGEGEVLGARAHLMRTRTGVKASLRTNELKPGNVYTLWWIVINNPENCAAYPEPCTSADILGNTEALQADVTYGGGKIARSSGKGRFASHLNVGELSNSWFGNGLDSVSDAEFHLIINDHGPKIPGLVGNMLHTYRGGCTDDSLPPPFPETAKADGIPGPNTCRLYQAAIFQR